MSPKEIHSQTPLSAESVGESQEVRRPARQMMETTAITAEIRGEGLGTSMDRLMVGSRSSER
jgi:hypothetical protein